MSRARVVQVAEEKSLLALEALFHVDGLAVTKIRGPLGARIMLRIPVSPYGIQIAVQVEVVARSADGVRVICPDRQAFWSELARARRVAVTLGKRRALDVRITQ